MTQVLDQEPLDRDPPDKKLLDVCLIQIHSEHITEPERGLYNQLSLITSRYCDYARLSPTAAS